MTSQPSTSNNPGYYDHHLHHQQQQFWNTTPVADPMNMYPMDYTNTSNLICSMQYFNNQNRYQLPPIGPPSLPPPPPPQSIPQSATHHLHHHHHLHHQFMAPQQQMVEQFWIPPPPAPQQQQQQQHMIMAPTTVPPQGAHSTQNATVTSAMDSCQQISHVLQCYQQGGEDGDFVRKAIESLVKKLKDKRIELDALITAVTSAGKQPTCCVTIQRSLDGRLQVAGRKGVPHVVYARIWRWPNVNKNELVKLVQCQTSPEHPDYICINPYHYERIVSNGIGATSNLGTQIDQIHVEIKKDFDFIPNSSISAQIEPGTSSGNSNSQDFSAWSPNFSNFSNANQVQQQQYQSNFEDRSFDLNQIVVPPPIQPLHYWCSIMYYELDTQIGEVFKGSSHDNGKVLIDGGMDPHGENEGRFCLGALSNVHRTEASEKARLYVGNGVELVAHSDGNVSLTSKCKIFVRSGYLDYSKGFEYGGTKAHRFTENDGSVTVFDIRWAFMQMMRRSESSNEAVRAQAAAVAGYAPLSAIPQIMPDSGVDGMRRDFCTIAISFVKGWGDLYHRQSIKETPCWIEVHLHRPLQLLDQLLKNNSNNSP
ncbi:unnamed protein product [Caenorhabditis angaria]|uniref:MAD homolog n=1 Tax=Caenorhabditis angaria TaxID=860376 RepID=A0A9P1N2A5_9PELO|nr:unnamed protein product [Caenorhabditis angaria]